MLLMYEVKLLNSIILNMYDYDGLCNNLTLLVTNISEYIGKGKWFIYTSVMIFQTFNPQNMVNFPDFNPQY